MITSMQPELTCPQCGRALPADAAQGLCPACVFEFGATGLDADSPTNSAEPLGMPTRRFGDYELIEEIARGGMGVVYKARQLSLDRIVAVKLILLGSLASAEQIRRFRIEASAAGSLQHPNIVAVHEVGLHEGQHFLVMDYVDGPNLSRFVQEHPFPAKKAAAYMLSIAQAVQYAHDRGILHRDLKPSNVLVGSDDRPRVTDFGLAKRFEMDSSLTLSGHVLGSPNYLPPEQAGGGRGKIGRASDVYSLGAILYHLLTARPPFQAETISETLQQVENSEPLAPRLLNSSVPRDLETICLKCLEKDPSRRYQSAQELAEELGRFVEGEPIQARPVGRAERACRWCGRNPALATSVALFLALLLVLGLGGPIAAYRINQARLLSEQSRRLAEQNRLLAQQNLYASDMRLASQAVHEGAFDRVRELLKKHVPDRGEVDLRGFEWRYLAHAVQESQPWHTLDGVAAPPGWGATRLCRWEGLLYNQSGDELKAWDMTNWGPVPIVRPAQSPSVKWEWDPDRGKAYAVDQLQHTLKVYTLPGFEPGLTFRLAGPISKVAMSPDGHRIAVGFREHDFHHVLVWDVEDGGPIGPLGNFEKMVTALVFSPDGTMLAASSTEGAVAIWDLTTRLALSAPPKSPSHLSGLEFTVDNKRLLCGEYSNFSVWDIAGGQNSHFEPPDPQGVEVAGLSLDRRYFVVKSSGFGLTLLASRTLAIKGTMLGHRGYVTKVTFSPDGRLIASASVDQSVRIWDIASRAQVGLLGGLGELIANVEFSADAQHILLSGASGRLGIHRLSSILTGGLFAKIQDPGGISGMALSSDESHIATISVVGTLALWDRSSGRLIRTNSNPRYREQSYANLAFSPDGQRLAWLTGDSLRIMVIASGKIIIEIPIEGNQELNPVAFSPDGREVAFGCKKELRLYQVDSGNQRPFVPADDEVSALTYSPDGTLIVFGDRLGTLTMCDRASKRVLSRKVKEHPPYLYDVEMSPDGRMLATCGADSSIKLWHVRPDGLVGPTILRGHTGYVHTLAFSPDGSRLSSTSGDQTVKIWDTLRAEELATLRGHHNYANAVAWAKNGQTIYSAGFDGEIRFWAAPGFAAIELFTKPTALRPKVVRK